MKKRDTLRNLIFTTTLLVLSCILTHAQVIVPNDVHKVAFSTSLKKATVQDHSGNQFITKSTAASWPVINFIATLGSVTTSTTVAFNSAMTLGLDPSYDAGLLRGSSGLNLYTRLVNDNGIDFAIQCLPESYLSLLIPVGLESKNAGNITFSVETVSLPADATFELVDSVAHVTTSLTSAAFSYTISVTAGTKGIGRFYLRIKRPAANTLWSGIGNCTETAHWSNGLPNAFKDATISSGNCVINANCTINNLTINPKSSLTVNQGVTLTVNGNIYLKSDADSTASLINNGTLSIVGSTIAERYLTGNKWHIITPIVAGESISTFLKNGNNAISTKKISEENNYGMMDYNEGTNLWNNYYTDAISGNLESGKGYCARREVDGVVSFAGTLTSGEKTVTLERGTEEQGWNCIGNPYPSSIDVNNDVANSFLAINSENLDTNYGAIYLWDDNLACYNVICNANFSFTQNQPNRILNQHYIAPGQGFFVKAASAGKTVTFTCVMQSHQNLTPFLKSAKALWPAIQLNMTLGEKKASTIVAFNSRMTKGLDPTYDAGLLRGTTGLNLYTKLVDDNGVDFAVQALPSAEESVVIPIGVESKNGGSITFSAKTVELPANTSVMLEDKTTGAITSLADSAVYTTTVEAGIKGIGRFYLITKSAKTITGISTDEAVTVSAYANNKTITINGKLAGAIAQLFDLNGKQVDSKKLTADNVSTLEENKLVDGVYILRVITIAKVYTFKVVL